MANEILENVWKIMKEKKFQYIDQLNNDLICNICKKLMINACSAPCGCRYCSECIANYLDGKDKFCIGKKKFCQIKKINYKKDVVIDYPANIQISEVIVKCPNKHCEFKDELSFIENHVRTCDKNPTSCPFLEIGCKNDEVMIDEMKDHLCTEIFCHTKLLLDFINNLQNDIESMKNENVELKSELKKELEIIRVASKINQMKNEEFEKKININLSEIEELNEEMVVIKNENRSMMNKLENIDKSRINDVNERIQRKSEQQTQEIDEMKKICKQTENKEIEMRRIIDAIFDTNADLMIKLNNYDEKINHLQIKIIEMELREGLRNSFGKLKWKIENFSRQQERTFIYSESFYSHKNGYKMCLSVWIAGDYVDVYLHFIKGEFDNDLLWPFKHGITIEVINQMNGFVYKSRTMKYNDDPNIQGWNKPTTERNDEILYITIDKTKKINRNNQMLIKCKINI